MLFRSNGTATHHAGGTVVEAGQFGQAMLVSTELAIATCLLVLVVATMAAYAFGRLRFRFGPALFAVIIATMIVPVTICCTQFCSPCCEQPIWMTVITRSGTGTRIGCSRIAWAMCRRARPPC